MTEETPGFEQKPDVPADAGESAESAKSPAQGDSAAQAAGNAAASSSEEAAAPGPKVGDAQNAEAAEPAEEAAHDMQDEQIPDDISGLSDIEGAGPADSSADLEQTRTALHERTQDLQRLQAEFQNYRRRVERDRVAVKEIAVANLLTELLPVLDDIGRARDHGELVGGFKSVAESLEMVAAKMGLMQFGKEGEPFDPTVHEALMHSYSPDVTETTCVQILQPGYRIGERTIRPARVGVAEPQPGASAKGEASGEAGEEENGGPDEG